MSVDYHQLLDAAIFHLEELKSRGVRFVPMSSAALTALNQAPVIAPARKNFSAPIVESKPAIIAEQRAPISTPKSTAQNSPIAPAASISGSAKTPTFSSSTEKTAAFADLCARALACVKCSHLASSRKNVVFGVGSLDAQLMFVGEAPGADEDVQGEPFVGKAGQLLTKIIQATGLSRADVYIANILKCRPDTPGQSAGNRQPTPEEMQTCIPFLHEQIDLIRPKVLIALGGTAVKGLLGETVGITKLRGIWQTYRDIPLMPTFHPSFLLRPENASKKRSVWEDMLAVMEKLEIPISEKQRNYFLKG